MTCSSAAGVATEARKGVLVAPDCGQMRVARLRVGQPPRISSSKLRSDDVRLTGRMQCAHSRRSSLACFPGASYRMANFLELGGLGGALKRVMVAQC